MESYDNSLSAFVKEKTEEFGSIFNEHAHLDSASAQVSILSFLTTWNMDRWW